MGKKVGIIIGVVLALAIPSGAGAAVSARTLSGTDQGDTIFGTRGPELIRGHRGADSIYTEGGNDVVRGGRGPDLIMGNLDAEGDGGPLPGASVIHCGPGFDVVALGPNDRAAANCESVFPWEG